MILSRRANLIVNNAVKDGKLIPLEICEVCGHAPHGKRDALEAHHWRGYQYPLDVWWVCRRCNQKLTGIHDGSMTLDQAKEKFGQTGAIEKSNVGLIERDTTISDRNPVAAYLLGLSPVGRRTMQSALDSVSDKLTSGRVVDSRLLDWTKLRYQHVQALRSVLMRDYEPATANKFMAAIRGVMRQAWLLGYITAEEYGRIKEVKGVKGSTLPAGRALTEAEITALLNHCAQDDRPSGARDGALIVLLRVAGLRRAELVGLQLSDYDRVNQLLRVQGKGNKEREVPVNRDAQQALADWLSVRGGTSGFIFCPINKSGRVNTRRPITAQAVYNIVNTRADAAGVRKLSPHDFRRTFVSDLLDAGADISTAQKLAGHSNVATTQRYDRRDVASRRDAVNLLKTNYRRRTKG